MSFSNRMWSVSLLILGVVISGCSMAAPKITNVGQAAITSGTFKPHELSGITYVGLISDNTYRYLAVSNTQKTVYNMDIKINITTGAVESAAVVSEIKNLEGTDLEGIAIVDSTSMLISDEKGPTIRKYSIKDGSLLGTMPLPSVLSKPRDNTSLEALAINPNDKTIWTANEEALTVDGNGSSIGKGTTIRIFKFAFDYSPAGQWAYNVDPIESAFLQHEMSGVPDMIALTTGQLLILERALDGKGFRSRVYLADLKGATDISSLAGLEGQSCTPAAKTLLWEKRFALGEFNNYEGMSLGPTLKDGSVSILLISDDNTNAFMGQTLYALKATGITKEVPEPAVQKP